MQYYYQYFSSKLNERLWKGVDATRYKVGMNEMVFIIYSNATHIFFYFHISDFDESAFDICYSWFCLFFSLPFIIIPCISVQNSTLCTLWLNIKLLLSLVKKKYFSVCAISDIRWRFITALRGRNSWGGRCTAAASTIYETPIIKEILFAAFHGNMPKTMMVKNMSFAFPNSPLGP